MMVVSYEYTSGRTQPAESPWRLRRNASVTGPRRAALTSLGFRTCSLVMRAVLRGGYSLRCMLHTVARRVPGGCMVTVRTPNNAPMGLVRLVGLC